MEGNDGFPQGPQAIIERAPAVVTALAIEGEWHGEVAGEAEECQEVLTGHQQWGLRVTDAHV